MPSDWVKGTMLVRCNSVVRGHSAVSLHVIETIMSLLQHNLTPVIPLRGTISASGDLSPLSYVAGAITGNPDIYVRTERGIISAEKALQQISISPITLGPKEGLGLMNGTATSAAVASLTLYETHHLAILSQILTSMALEALLGSVGNYDPFIAKVRPHEGQIESARAIRQFLQGSSLARGPGYQQDDRQSSGLLYQDRYALRTASQWIGPQLEDLTLAHRQVTTELNSTTDNPLVDISGETTHHGGNFQAVSITSAMEKTRLSLQMIGKLLFAQCSELINPMLNNGLPPNLAADEPSLSFTLKGVDIGMASYMSELAFLANPVSSHVQSAEMHNQALNSLAFISTRYTSQTVDLVSIMSASYLYTVCQALDLRVLQRNFFHNLEPTLYTMNHEMFGSYLTPATVDELNNKLWTHVKVTWLLTSNKDTHERVDYIVNMALAILTEYLISEETQPYLSEASAATRAWKTQAKEAILESFLTTRSRFFAHQNTINFLGRASSNMYTFVRKTLKVPFHKGLEDHPTPRAPESTDGARKQTIGSWIGIIYESLRDGRLHEPMMRCLAEADLVPGTDLAHQISSDSSIFTDAIICQPFSTARLNSYTADNPTESLSINHGTVNGPAKPPATITATNDNAVKSNGINCCAMAHSMNGDILVGTSRGMEKKSISPSSVCPMPGYEKAVNGNQSVHYDRSIGSALDPASTGEKNAIGKHQAHNNAISGHSDVHKTQSHPMIDNIATETVIPTISRTHRKSKSSSSVGFGNYSHSVDGGIVARNRRDSLTMAHGALTSL